MLILRDVLEFPAAEAADLLGTTTTAVNSGLRRARAQLAQVQPAGDELAEPADAGQRALLDRFAAAFENADASALAELLREDVALEMPPLLTWFSGRQTVVRFIASRVFARFGRFRMVPVTANGRWRSRRTRANTTGHITRTKSWCPPSPGSGSRGSSSSLTRSCRMSAAARVRSRRARARCLLLTRSAQRKALASGARQASPPFSHDAVTSPVSAFPEPLSIPAPYPGWWRRRQRSTKAKRPVERGLSQLAGERGRH